jgi:hypothetical protein
MFSFVEQGPIRQDPNVHIQSERPNPLSIVTLGNRNDEQSRAVFRQRLMALAQRWGVYIHSSFRGVRYNILILWNPTLHILLTWASERLQVYNPSLIHRNRAEHNRWTPDKVDYDQIRSYVNNYNEQKVDGQQIASLNFFV